MKHVKHLLLPVLCATGCRPSVDFDLDLDLGPGPVTGDNGAATFSFVDGCPGEDLLFGCPRTLPRFAVGARARLVIGSVSGDADDQHRIERARPRSQDQTIVDAGRDPDGLLVLEPRAPGDTTVELIEDGELIDSIAIHVETIASMETHASPPPLRLAGARFPASIAAFGPSHALLFARHAITAKTFDGLMLEPDYDGYFTASDHVAVISNTPGDATIQFSAAEVSAEATFRVVTRAEITTVTIGELVSTPNTNKAHLVATNQVDGVLVRGGPACDWRIVSGGGPGVELAPRIDDDLDSSKIVLFNSAVVYGSGDTVIECRANERAVGQYTVHLAP